MLYIKTLIDRFSRHSQEDTMSWTNWGPGKADFQGFQVKINVDNQYGWVHYLVAPPDEAKPDDNHIHLKCSTKTAEWLVAAVKVDRIDVINRRKLIEAINRETGLNLQYR